LPQPLAGRRTHPGDRGGVASRADDCAAHGRSVRCVGAERTQPLSVRSAFTCWITATVTGKTAKTGYQEFGTTATASSSTLFSNGEALRLYLLA
jgi:hypothetical protein